MSTRNICFRREIRKILCGYPLLSVAMPQNPVLDHGRSVEPFFLMSFMKLANNHSAGI